ncbi:MAG: 16S rRNA (guanine(527)-N(7))-methyltransferase RsmG [Acidimicrobiia bacterium]
MKHGSTDPDVPRETENTIEPDVLAAWLGIGLDLRQQQALADYAAWLIDEAVAAGGIGPAETHRIWQRHIYDSLAYVRKIPGDATSIIDVGSGVGLPGIPVAIVRPDLSVRIVDRAERRTHLARRAVRLLDLENAVVETADITRSRSEYDVALFRASLPLDQAAGIVSSVVRPGGVALFGLSRREEPPMTPDPPAGVSFALSDEADAVLDSPFWLLTMRVADEDQA